MVYLYNVEMHHSGRKRSIYTCVISCVCLASSFLWVCPFALLGKTLDTNMQNFCCCCFCLYIFHTFYALLTSTILDHFEWPWPCVRVTRYVESKAWWLHWLFYWSGWIKWNNCVKNLCASVHSGIMTHELIWFKLGMMMEAIVKLGYQFEWLCWCPC